MKSEPQRPFSKGFTERMIMQDYPSLFQIDGRGAFTPFSLPKPPP